MAGRLPPGLRATILHSPVGRLVQHVMGGVVGQSTRVVPVHGLLVGHRMKLDLRWQRGMAYGDYERAVATLIDHTVQPGWSVADIGAQIGYMTLLMAHRVGPSGRVFAFEPLPANNQTLRENISLNGYQTVSVERLALSNQPGRVSFYVFNDQTLSPTSSLVGANGQATAIEVEAMRLDDYLAVQGGPLHFAKLDVEGAESLVIDGMRQTIERWRPLLLIEIHPLASGPNPTIAKLQDLGYMCHAVYDNGGTSSARPDYVGHIFAAPR